MPAKPAAPAEVPAQAAKPKKVHAENDPGKLRRKIKDLIEQGYIDGESVIVDVVNTMRENRKVSERAQSIDGFLVEEMQEILQNLES